MNSTRLLLTLLFRVVPPAFLLMCLPGVGRAQLIATATYTTNNGGNVNMNQKTVAVGPDGYTRFLVLDTGGLTYVRCLDEACGTYNTQQFPPVSSPVYSWLPPYSPFAYSLAIGPDGYARIAYQTSSWLYDGDGEPHNGVLGLIQCSDADCASSTNNPFIDYVSNDAIASVAVGSDGTAYIAYDNGNYQDGPQGIGLATCNAGGCSTTTLVANISVFDFIAATIAIGSDGNPVVAYADDHFSDDGYFTYLSSTGHYYENGTDTVVTSDASLTDLSIGPDGFARIYVQNHAFWDSDATPGAIFVECNDAPCSSPAVNPISLSGVTFSSYGSISVAADGTARAEIDLGSSYPNSDSSYYVECTAADCSTYNSSVISADAGYSAALASMIVDQSSIPIMITEDLSSGVVYQAKDLANKLSCSPSSLVRGGRVRCAVIGAPSGATFSQWKFVDSTGGSVVSNQTGSSWSGTMVTSGTVSVKVTSSGGSPTLSASITLTARSSWAFAAVSPTPEPNNSSVSCGTLSVQSPPVQNGRLGVSCLELAVSFNDSTVTDSGPNQGYHYVVSVSSSYQGTDTAYYYVISPDLSNTSSAFYNAQTGTYDPQNNPNGYISGANLLADTIRHESGMTNGHYGNYVTAQNVPANNVGVIAEAETSSPNQTVSQFESQVNTDLTNARNTIQTAFAKEPCGSIFTYYDATCSFQGYVNYDY